MTCPACCRALTQLQAHAIVVDACQGGCGGTWFDGRELQAVEYSGEDPGPLLEIDRDPAVMVDPAKRLQCPRCEGVVMMRHFDSVKHLVTLDECPQCGGFWLDHGELAKLRAG